MKKLYPIKLLPARERVASALRKAIFAQDLKEGEVLALEATAEQLGVSVTPVREAFQILARDGFIALRPNKGAVVLGVQESLIRDHYELRAILESAACRLICEKNADLSGIIDAHEGSLQSVQEQDAREYGSYNQSFHFEIWTACGNERLRSTVADLWNGLSVGIDTNAIEYAQLSLQEHAGVLEALQARNAELAQQRMYAHIMRSMNSMLSHYKASSKPNG